MAENRRKRGEDGEKSDRTERENAWGTKTEVSERERNGDRERKRERHWKESTTTKQSQLECYLALHREYTAAEYLTTVTDPKLRKALTMYRLSEHIAIEKGRRRQTWLSREDRLCAHCPQNEVETELHFLTSCQMYDHIRDTHSLRLHRPTKNLKTNQF